MNKTQAVVPPNFDNLPPELKKLDRWVGWRYEQKSGSEKAAKVPKRTNGTEGNASSTNPATWGTYEQALVAFQKGGLSGVGIVLNGDGLVGVDLDHCVIDGVPSEKAMALLDKLGAGYIEISPSGGGLRALGYGEQIRGINGTLDGLKAEFYSSGRYLTLTGRSIKAGPLNPLEDFKATAASFDPKAKVNQETGQCVDVLSDLDRSAIGKQREPKDVALSTDTDPLATLVNSETLRDLRSALTALRADNRVQWVDVGLALKTLGEHGRALWLEWSQTSDKYEPRDASDRWESFKPTKTGYQFVFSEAQAAGWLNPKSHSDTATGFPDQLEQTTANAQRYKLLSGADLRNLPPLAWRVRGVLPAVGLAALFGPSASGKSFLAFDLAAAIAEGARWFDCRVEAAPVVYAVLEGEAGFKLRAQAWEVHQGRDLPDGLNLVLQGFALTEPQDVADLAAAIPDGAVTILDTLNRAAPTADENSSRDMGEILQAAKALQALTNGLVLLVHHTGKNAAAGLRGHSSLFAAMDAAIEVSRDGDYREWRVAKAKDGQDGVSHLFKLHIEALGRDDCGDPVTSCVIVRDTNAHQKPLAANSQMGLTALNAGLAEDLFGTSVHRDVWREHFYSLHPSDITDSKRTAFNRAVGDLVKDGHVIKAQDMFSTPDF